MNYDNVKYVELKRICKERGLGGAGTRPELLAKLQQYDNETGDAPPKDAVIAVDRAGRPLVREIPVGAKLTDPDPNNLNYDLSGRWRRRSPKWIGWAEDGSAILKE